MTPWPEVSLAEVATAIDYGLNAGASAGAVGPRLLRITDIQDDRVDWSRVPRCARTFEPAMALKPGDIVFARTGATTGKSFLVRACPEDAVFASYLIRVRLDDTSDPRFVSHFFGTPRYWAQISQSARGVAQPGVNATVLGGLRLPSPPLAEQRRIADILDRANALRAKRRAAFALLDTLAKSIFQAFAWGAGEGAWPRAEFGDTMAEVYRYPTYFGIRYESDGVPEIRGELLRSDGTIVTDRCALRFISRRTSERFPRTVLRAGDLVMSVRGTIGKVSIVPPELEGANMTANLMRLSPKLTENS